MCGALLAVVLNLTPQVRNYSVQIWKFITKHAFQCGLFARSMMYLSEFNT